MARFGRALTFLALLLSSPVLHSQSTAPAAQNLTGILSFETNQKPGFLQDWRASPPGQVFADDAIVHSGRWAARLEGDAAKSPSTVITRSMPLEFSGSRVELRGFLRTEAVSEFTGLWLREDSESGPVAFENMQSRRLAGTSGWTLYSIGLPIRPEARTLYFGVLLAGDGKVWADDLELVVDGKPVWQAPRVERPKTPLDLDREFASGSRIIIDNLSAQQIENLSTLGKVWGFLKYHHPRVVEGTQHWDYELFRIMPPLLAARDRAAANAVMLAWMQKLGTPSACDPCARLDDTNIQIGPELDWIADETSLGRELSLALRETYRNRPSGGPQFYVSLNPGVGNPSFDHEMPYEAVTLPDAGYQLLGLYRFWNIIRYWFPYRDVIGQSWDAVLVRFIPRVATANSREAYQLALMALIATVNDTHANLWSSLNVRPPVGECQLPAEIRFVENVAVVAGYTDESIGPTSALRIGDVITHVDGKAVTQLIEGWQPYYAASNEPTRLRDIARSLGRGPCGETSLAIRRDGREVTVRAARVRPSASMNVARTHDLPGETFRLLSDAVAYLKLSSLKSADIPRYIESSAGTRGLVIDIRNYPSEFVVFTLGSALATQPAEFARFTIADLANPGAFRWRGPSLVLRPGKDHYNGTVVVLVDEITQSNAEYTTMAFRAAGAVVVGSTTAGADGNVSQVPLPGGLRSMISGIGVFYPDRRPTQRVGIVPDVEARPTIAGIRDGRDEVLEAGLRRILGPGTTPADIEKIVKEARGGTAPKKRSSR